jgi:hypothetical protein
LSRDAFASFSVSLDLSLTDRLRAMIGALFEGMWAAKGGIFLLFMTT